MIKISKKQLNIQRVDIENVELLQQALVDNGSIRIHNFGTLQLKKPVHRSPIGFDGKRYTTKKNFRITFKPAKALIRICNDLYLKQNSEK